MPSPPSPDARVTDDDAARIAARLGATVRPESVSDATARACEAFVDAQLARGRRGELLGDTYAPVPAKWARRGQSREMVQYGAFTHSNRVRDDVAVEPLPETLKTVVRELCSNGVLTEDEAEGINACTINVYERGQWIPPHIDHPAFARPFVTVSLASAQTMTLGRGMVWPSGDERPDAGTRYEGEEVRVVMPVRSAVRMEGAAANEYEHAVPPVSERRVSLTFRRRMDVDGEREAIEAQTTLTEAFRAVYRTKRRDRAVEETSTSGSGATETKPSSEEELRRARIVAERAAVKAAREARKRAKQLRKAGKTAEAEAAEALAREIRGLGDDGETTTTTSETTTSELPSVELVKKPPKRACAVVPENLIDATKTVTAMPDVEREHVQKVYDIVAQQWHGTRYRAWTGVETFVRKQPPGCLVADVGCGNGKNIPEVMRGGGVALGSDFSRGLIEICRDTGYEVMVADAVLLPYRSNVFDYALNIAVLHHISSPERRVELVKETMRVVRIGGCALFYAWALEQEQGGVSGHQFQGQDVLVPFHNKIKVKGVSPEDERARQAKLLGAPAHGEADAEKRSVVYQRYCHVYTEGELPKLFDALQSWCVVEASYYDHGNWCCEVRKIAETPP